MYFGNQVFLDHGVLPLGLRDVEVVLARLLDQHAAFMILANSNLVIVVALFSSYCREIFIVRPNIVNAISEKKLITCFESSRGKMILFDTYLNSARPDHNVAMDEWKPWFSLRRR